MKKCIPLQIVLLLLLCTHVRPQTVKVAWFSFDMGYAEPKFGNTVLKSVIGQPWIGDARHSNTQILSGFLTDTLFRGAILGVEGSLQVPGAFALLQNYPNPFNPSTTIRYEIPGVSEVRMSVFDMLGREVTVLVNERKDAGVYEVRFDGTTFSSGVYFYRLRVRDPSTGPGFRAESRSFTQTRKLLLLK